MSIKQYNEQKFHETNRGEGNAIEAFLPDRKAPVAQVRHFINNNHGKQESLSLATPGKDRFRNVSDDNRQPPDFVLFVTALITMFLGFVFFKHYRVLESQLRENGG